MFGLAAKLSGWGHPKEFVFEDLDDLDLLNDLRRLLKDSISGKKMQSMWRRRAAGVLYRLRDE